MTENAKITRSRRLTWTWLIPIFILLMAGVAYWQQYRDIGPLIKVTFNDATGISAGQTKVYYRSVEIGKVASLELTNDLNSVVANIRMIPSLRDKIGDSMRFWIVSPTIGANGISGLDAILSGAYIEADWVGDMKREMSEFIGLDKAPLTSPGAPGKRITLRGESAMSLSLGSPLYFRGIPVGKLEGWNASPDGEGVFLTVFINAPYDEHLTEDTRFWNASGFEIDLNGLNAKVNYAAIQTILLGGIEFEQLGTSKEPLATIAPIKLYPSKSVALKDIAKDNDDPDSSDSSANTNEDGGIVSDDTKEALNNIATNVEALIVNLNEFIGQQNTMDMPGEINKSLKSINQTTKSLNTALESINFEELSDSITTILNSGNNSLAKLDDSLNALSSNSELYYEIVATLRELRETSNSIKIFVNTITEKPNSIILGR